MNSDPFDYGGDDDSPTKDATPSNQLDEIFGSSDSEHPRPNHQPNGGLGMRVTVQVVVAVILLTLAGGLLARDVWARRTRDTAFRHMIDANNKREYLRVMEAAEKFLTYKSLNGSGDTREGGVANLYGEALVHWVAQQPGKLDANAHAHVARYKKLVKNPDK
jgi:hypothetical protein